MSTYSAACFCGGVRLEVSGTPLFVGYCHCESCRTWLGAPLHGATLWPTDGVRIVAGESLLATYSRKPRSQRKHCTRCGGAVMNAHPSEGMIDVMASLLHDYPFRPTMHVHYDEHVMAVPDDLPKYRDLPKEWGGSGDLAPESG